MRILILGGTAEARALADECLAAGIETVSSLAGRVRDPALPVGEVRIGGFGGVDGLRKWLRNNHPDAVLDATHPFAATISTHAWQACHAEDVPILMVRRPPWEARATDRWIEVDSITAAANYLSASHPERVFLTTGRRDLAAFADLECWCLIRVVDPPAGPLPPRHRILTTRGPYHLDYERKLLHDNHIDVLVTKNSGGAMTHPKVIAAAELGVAVVMISRPEAPLGTVAVSSVKEAMGWLRSRQSGG